MGGMEAVITGLTDDFKILKRNRKVFTFVTAFGTFLVALLCVTNVSISATCTLSLGMKYSMCLHNSSVQRRMNKYTKNN